MTTQMKLLAAAVMTVGFAGLPRIAYADDKAPAAQNAENVLAPGQLPPGVNKSDKDHSDQIRSSLAKTTESVLNKDGLHELTEQFVDFDHDRLSKWAKDHKDDQAYKNIVQQIRNDWKAKYNQDFDIPASVVFGSGFKDFMIAQGEIANPNLMSNWPVENKLEGIKDGQKNEGGKPSATKLEKGRKIAVVTYPASHGLPEVNVSLVHEVPMHWKLDLPDNIDGQKLHANLLAQLNKFEQMKDQWPADVNEGYRMLSHCAMVGIYGIQPSATGENLK